MAGSLEIGAAGGSGLAMSRGTAIGCPPASPAGSRSGAVAATGMADFCVTGLGVGDADALGWRRFLFGGGDDPLGNWLRPGPGRLPGRQTRVRCGKFGLGFGQVLLASSKSALAFLACFLARLAMSLTSLRLRLAIRACSFAAFHRLSVVATRRRAI